MERNRCDCKCKLSIIGLPVGREVEVIMKDTVKFKDYLKEELKDQEFSCE